MTTNEKLSLLREKMAEAGVQAYLIPSSDPHISEYLPDHWRARAWLSGFDGSAGTLVVTETESGLWTDGRYFIQAERQMAGSEIVLYRMKEKGVPTIQEFLLSRLKEGEVLGIDGMVTAAETVLDMETAFSAQGIGIQSEDLITPIWTDRPAIPQSQVYLLPEQYTGLSAAEKIAQVRSRLKENGADAMAVTRLDSIAWLLNLRASDVVYNTSFVSYVLLTQETAVLYVDSSRVSEEAMDYLKKNGVAVRPYGEILDGIAAINVPTVMLVSVENVNYRLYLAMEENPRVTIVKGEEPVFCLKAVKNPVEIANTKNAHIKEGVAMARLQMCLEEKLAAGETISETDVGELLVNFRKEQEGYMEDSFAVIAAYGANAAMMHYHPTPENHAVLQRKGFLLLDTGGQYVDGTTDTTRTYALGELTDEERRYYTYVLKANIGIARTVFMEGCSGANLDIMSRTQIWKYGLDYRCGTGHGVGFAGPIHEGPQSLRMTNHVPFQPGMTITDEPGIYEEGLVGVRIENELLVVEHMETKYGKFYAFQPFTYLPIDTTPVVLELMNEEEISWLNDYHQMVYDTLSPCMTERERIWLKEKTKPLEK